MKRITVNLSEEEHAALLALAAKRGRSLSYICAEAVRRQIYLHNKAFASPGGVKT